MTDLSRLPLLQTVLPSESVVGTNATDPLPPVPNLVNGFSLEEEEEFTIKCICDYQDDDGNTVFCETCDTWQHIDCYYRPENVPGKDDNHSCVDCEPRPLDARLATERQRAKRVNIDVGERKIKKPPSKSHKKRVKPLDHQNAPPGWGDLHSPRNGANGSPREQPPTKRHKSSHKPSNSTHIQSATGKAPNQSRRSASASHPLQSPSKPPIDRTLDLNGEPYTAEFMRLYDDDTGETPARPNFFDSIATTNQLAKWTDDVEELERATQGRTPQEVFLRCEQSVDSMPPVSVKKGFKEDDEKEFHGHHPKWFYLTTESKLVSESFIGELRGKIGHMRDYVRDEANRWESLRHPLPFVFFHPTLPIYIDTRKEGTIFRYVRRSCRPNIVLKTILENGSDYRFCFMAKQDIEPDEELTLAWTTDEHVRAITQSFGATGQSEASTESDEGYVLSWFNKVFADFGGCACGPPEDCTLNKVAHKLRGASDPPSVNGKAKRARKAGSNTARISSRSGSEAVRYQDEDDQDDAQSTSTSSRSKPQSRDMTPSNPSSVEAKGTAPGLEVSERDKRKIAALEKMEQDKNQPAQKKKKRNSGNAAVSNPSGSTAKQTIPNSSNRTRYVDASTNSKQSVSPTARTSFAAPAKTSPPSHSPPIPSPLCKTIYVDASVQTDPDPDDLLPPVQSLTLGPSRKKFISLKKRLLTRAHEEKTALEEQLKTAQKEPVVEAPSTEMVWTDGSFSPAATMPSLKAVHVDVQMENDPTSPVSPQTTITSTIDESQPRQPGSPTKVRTESLQSTVLPLQPPPLPQTLNNGLPTSAFSLTNGFRNNNLRIPLPPSATLITNGAPPTPTTLAQSPIAQSPSTLLTPSHSSSILQPSPVKKKMTLGDYMKRKPSVTSNSQTPAAQVRSTNDTEKDKDKDTDGGSSPTASGLGVDGTQSLAPIIEETPQGNGSGTPPLLKEQADESLHLEVPVTAAAAAASDITESGTKPP